ncbi:NUDIX hydrolase [Pontibacillus sp. HN14]|uniref:NUDIX hydrolase n=1 Tax=Pontibacillus chungwhensis TaxID=265426 RepID=A0ABY8V333_9BACI|nr:NUDIX hydrolase [Pontibacillus chungwhensis]MCD5322306.1 NUDIX hydrolase [Pontibacillus sp. HN14]WIG00160.1 NUDIX hydrolase [Pontibacillus chungwhensis]
MNQWVGASGVCVNEDNEILMVLQGKPEEDKKWTVPSGGVEGGESFRDCCKREINEETGYQVEVVEELKVKKGCYKSIHFEVHYFKAEVIGGTRRIQDPDGLILDIDWKSREDLKTLPLSFPEDLEFLLRFLT